MADMKRIAGTTALIIGASAIIVACLVVYIPAMKAGFIWDDDWYVTNNPLLTAPDGLYRIWFSRAVPSQYFPLTYTTFWVEHRLWGLDPMGYHVVNVVIHIINALLLWLVLRRLSIPGAWFAAAVFALHPVQVESVAWITERKNVLMLFFSLLTVLCWLEFVIGSESGRKASRPALGGVFYAGSLFLYALALFSKATACTLPLALILILWLKRTPLTLKRWLQVVPYIVMGIGMGLFVMWWEKHHQGTGTVVNLGLNPAARLLIAGRALWFYLWKLFWPANLTFSYPRWHIDPAVIRQYAWPAASILAIACVWLWRKRLGRGTVTATLFFVAMLFPMLGFFSLFTFVYTFVADHYQYAAGIGPVALVAAGGALILRRTGGNIRMIVLSAAGVLLLVLSVLTWRQCQIYTNTRTLWQDTLNKNPDSWLAHGQITKMLFEQGKFIEAKPYLEKAIKFSSYMKTVDPIVYAAFVYNMGIVFEEQRRLDDAISHYQKALDISESSAAHFRLARLLANQGKVEQSRPHFLRALEMAKAEKNNGLTEETFRWLELLERKKQTL